MNDSETNGYGSTARVPSNDETEDESDFEMVENVSSGVTVVGKAKMGSGTRDQSEVKIKGKGKDAAEAVEDFETALEAAEERDWGERLLNLNPERSTEE